MFVRGGRDRSRALLPFSSSSSSSSWREKHARDTIITRYVTVFPGYQVSPFDTSLTFIICVASKETTFLSRNEKKHLRVVSTKAAFNFSTVSHYRGKHNKTGQ